MNTELKLELTDAESEGISRLISLCNTEDQTKYDTEAEGDFYYILENPDPEETGVKEEIIAVLFGYRIGEREEGQEVLEISAFTHPGLRRQGFFRMLLDALKDDFRAFRYHFLVKPENSEEFIREGILPESTKGCIEAMNLQNLGGELFMKKSLEKGISDPGDSLSDQYGEVHLSPYGERTLYLYGLLVYDRYLGKGYGRKMMEHVEQYAAGPYTEILLQVSSRNEIACSLYRKLGYQILDRTELYALPL